MRDAVPAILFWAMIALSLSASVYPWRIQNRVSRVLMHLPLSLVPMIVVYESLMPVEMNIRVDLLVLLPLFALVALCYIAKLARLSRRHEDESNVA